MVVRGQGGGGEGSGWSVGVMGGDEGSGLYVGVVVRVKWCL